MISFFKKAIPSLLLSFILMAHTMDINASTPPSISISKKEIMGEIVNITTHESKLETTVNVLFDSKISNYTYGLAIIPKKSDWYFTLKGLDYLFLKPK
jgi:hypothetical protein